MKLQSRIEIRGRVTVCFLEPGTGKEISRYQSPNMVVDTGLGLIADLLIDDESTGLTYIAIGTDGTAAAAGQPTLVAEHARTFCYLRERTAGVITLSAFFSSGDSGIDILEAGIFGADATAVANSGTMFARTVIAGKDNSAGTMDTSVTWDITIARA